MSARACSDGRLAQALEHLVAHDEHRERLLGAPLELAQPRERELVERVDGEAVERLRRVGDDLAAPQRHDGDGELLGGAGHARPIWLASELRA